MIDIEGFAKVVAELQAKQAELTRQVKEELTPSLADKNVPLDDRWKMFIRLVTLKLLPEQSYGDGYVEVLGSKYSLYDDFHIERYQTVDYEQMWEWISDSYRGKKFEGAAVDKWREQVLASGYGSFVHDW